jgi:hypothetical protein
MKCQFVVCGQFMGTISQANVPNVIIVSEGHDIRHIF